jgi:queuine tRNA-ribosyltransferase
MVCPAIFAGVWFNNIMFTLTYESKKSSARLGVLHTAHGPIETPVFMPVGTQATVKGVGVDDLHKLNTSVILGNVYHLNLRPTSERIAALGGLHHFMNWRKPILTDSGGYQVFSLKNQRTIDADGVTFKSHLDGSSHRLTPKRVIDIQRQLGSDIMMPLDICTPYPSTITDVQSDMSVTHRWEKDALDYWLMNPNQQLLFGLVQGGVYSSCRKSSVETLAQWPFSGFAIGGLSVGEPRDLLDEMTAYTAHLLPKNKPRYLMGVGLPENFKSAIASGIDMFDCVAPTRLARHGHFFTTHGKQNIRNTVHQDSSSPLDERCSCRVCAQYSRAYIRHLTVAKEVLAVTLLSVHNIAMVFQIIDDIKQDIRLGLF